MCTVARGLPSNPKWYPNADAKYAENASHHFFQPKAPICADNYERTGMKEYTNDVWSSLLPDHMMTSAGEVFVAMVLL